MMKNTGLAAVIERDLLHNKRVDRDDITKCCTCGAGMVYRNNRFCSDRCRDYYDAGNPGLSQDWLRPKSNYGVIGWKVVAGPPGLEIGSDYYVPLGDAFVEREDRRQAKKSELRIPHYVIRKGRGSWRPNPRLRAAGFQTIDCGPDGPSAQAIAQQWNGRARRRSHRKAESA
jgi:hypothetical protein